MILSLFPDFLKFCFISIDLIIWLLNAPPLPMDFLCMQKAPSVTEMPDGAIKNNPK